MRRAIAIAIAFVACLAGPAAAQAKERASTANTKGVCSEVVLGPDLSESQRKEVKQQEALGNEFVYRWVFDVLLKRIFSAAARPGSEASRVGSGLSRHYGKYMVDVDGLECKAATGFVRSEFLRWDRVEVGIVGEEPTFTNSSFQSSVKVGEYSVGFVLREQVADLLRDITAKNIGKDLYVDIDGKRAAIIPIREPIDSGELFVKRDRVPQEMLDQPFLLPFRMEVLDCRACEQTKPGAPAK